MLDYNVIITIIRWHHVTFDDHVMLDFENFYEREEI